MSHFSHCSCHILVTVNVILQSLFMSHFSHCSCHTSVTVHVTLQSLFTSHYSHCSCPTSISVHVTLQSLVVSLFMLHVSHCSYHKSVTVRVKNKLRIIIGGIRGTSHQKLYKESGFCTLKERRKRHKLLMFHRMILGLCPQYISDLLPPLVAHINPYHRRRPLERDATTYKTELYRNSFIPSTTAEWDSLPISVQQSLYILKCF